MLTNSTCTAITHRVGASPDGQERFSAPENANIRAMLDKARWVEQRGEQATAIQIDATAYVPTPILHGPAVGDRVTFLRDGGAITQMYTLVGTGGMTFDSLSHEVWDLARVSI